MTMTDRDQQTGRAAGPERGPCSPAVPAHRSQAVGVAFLTASLLVLLAGGGLFSSCAPQARRSGVDGPGRLAVPDALPPEPSAPVVRVRVTRGTVREIRLSTTGPYRVLVDGRQVASGARLPGVRARRVEGTWRIGNQSFTGRVIRLQPQGGSYLYVGPKGYRGELYLHPDGADGLLAVNHLDLESYLAGVLSSELYARWPDETYKAQAVAARTFALYHKLRGGGQRVYDLVSDTNWQVYGGFSAETPPARQAVQATRGQVLTHRRNGRDEVFMAQYSACNGGWVNGARVIRAAADTEPLAGGQRDPHGRSCPRFTWPTVRVSKQQAYAALMRCYPSMASLGGLAALRPVEVTDYGRVVWLDVLGRNGRSERIRAEDLRIAMVTNQDLVPQAKALYSMNCRIVDLGSHLEFRDGKGFGHGVGLSQWGAYDKARAGWSATEILAFYYPGAKVRTLY